MDALHERIAFVRKGMGLTQDEFAAAISALLKQQGAPPITRGAVGNWERPGRGIDIKNMRVVAQLAEVSLDWLDRNVGDAPSLDRLRRAGERFLGFSPALQAIGAPAPVRGSVAVMGQAAGATLDQGVAILFDQEPIGELPMLPGLVGLRDVYALEATGTSMEPMFRHGDPLYVSPHTPIRRDDPMIVIEHRSRDGEPIAFIKLMVENRRQEVVARQLNPALEITFRKKPGLSLHRVLTMREAIGYNGVEVPPQAPLRVRRGPKR